ncbi:hypothetical protein BDV18DRAFT_155617 [Aspergillus unguis]
MRLFNPIDTFDSVFTINRRQLDSLSSCGGGVAGTGECRPASCKGIIYANQCRQNADEECCLVHNCNVTEGHGYCRNSDNQTCAGKYFAGEPPYPCPGPNYILCCVEWENMLNGTSSNSTSSSSDTTLTTSSSTGPSSAPSSTASEEVQDDGGSGLTGSQKGGIAGGIVGAVAVTSIVFLVFFFRRRQKWDEMRKSAQREVGEDDENKGPATATGAAAVDMGTGTEEGTGADGAEGGGIDNGEGGETAAMLASREKVELDASGRALHELESPATRTEKDIRRLPELPGSIAAAEMAVPEREEPKR